MSPGSEKVFHCLFRSLFQFKPFSFWVWPDLPSSPGLGHYQTHPFSLHLRDTSWIFSPFVLKVRLEEVTYSITSTSFSFSPWFQVLGSQERLLSTGLSHTLFFSSSLPAARNAKAAPPCSSPLLSTIPAQREAKDGSHMSFFSVVITLL